MKIRTKKVQQLRYLETDGMTDIMKNNNIEN